MLLRTIINIAALRSAEELDSPYIHRVKDIQRYSRLEYKRFKCVHIAVMFLQFKHSDAEHAMRRVRRVRHTQICELCLRRSIL